MSTKAFKLETHGNETCHAPKTIVQHRCVHRYIYPSDALIYWNRKKCRLAFFNENCFILPNRWEAIMRYYSRLVNWHNTQCKVMYTIRVQMHVFKYTREIQQASWTIERNVPGMTCSKPVLHKKFLSFIVNMIYLCSFIRRQANSISWDSNMKILEDII